ncbi:hypothetical protein ACFS07_31995 [Undibacterium arcticum]
MSAITQERVGQPVGRVRDDNAGATEARIKEILAQPLTPDSAVRIALLNNQGLQAMFAELDVAEADLVQAGWLRNPGFSFSRVHTGDNYEINRSIMFDFCRVTDVARQKQNRTSPL